LVDAPSLTLPARQVPHHLFDYSPHPAAFRLRAFLNTELDDNDLTYFLLYHVQVIERSIQAFQAYLAKKIVFAATV